MNAFEIRGGRPLRGQCSVYGAKNAALPILAASVMVEGTCEIEGVPELEDVKVMVEILKAIGARVERVNDKVIVDSRNITQNNVPTDLMRKMRSPILRIRSGLASLEH